MLPCHSIPCFEVLCKYTEQMGMQQIHIQNSNLKWEKPWDAIRITRSISPVMRESLAPSQGPAEPAECVKIVYLNLGQLNKLQILTTGLPYLPFKLTSRLFSLEFHQMLVTSEMCIDNICSLQIWSAARDSGHCWRPASWWQEFRRSDSDHKMIHKVTFGSIDWILRYNTSYIFDCSWFFDETLANEILKVCPMSKSNRVQLCHLVLSSVLGWVAAPRVQSLPCWRDLSRSTCSRAHTRIQL